MEARAKIFGHSIHQMLIAFPLGLLATSILFDFAWLVFDRSELATVAFWMIISGVGGGLLAAVFGIIDWVAIPLGTRAKVIGMWHGAGNVSAVILFSAGLVLRLPDPQHPSLAAIGISAVAVAIAAISGWLGGELVDRLGVGVDDGAHLNAPSSLSGRPASEQADKVPVRNSA
jgi:uncharacterized membrane protein